jgi:hypothetical protein
VEEDVDLHQRWDKNETLAKNKSPCERYHCPCQTNIWMVMGICVIGTILSAPARGG